MAARWTHKRLQRVCRDWQHRLRLNDWEVKIVFASLEDLPAESQGACDWNLHARTAEIKVLDPKEWDSAIPQDVENTVVHELIHLHLAPWDTKNKAQEIQMEQAIESLSGAFVSLKRRKK